MRIEDVRRTSFVSELYCDRCGAKAKHDIAEGFNNFLQIEFDSSWGSAIGDGVHVEIDLCHSCVQETLGPWLRRSLSDWNRPPDGGALSEPDGLSSEQHSQAADQG